LLVVSLTFVFCLHCFVLVRFLVSYHFFFHSNYVSLNLEASIAMGGGNGVRVSPLLYSCETQCIYVLCIQRFNFFIWFITEDMKWVLTFQIFWTFHRNHYSDAEVR
jgi:hypothetical protein